MISTIMNSNCITNHKRNNYRRSRPSKNNIPRKFKYIKKRNEILKISEDTQEPSERNLLIFLYKLKEKKGPFFKERVITYKKRRLKTSNKIRFYLMITKNIEQLKNIYLIEFKSVYLFNFLVLIPLVSLPQGVRGLFPFVPVRPSPPP